MTGVEAPTRPPRFSRAAVPPMLADLACVAAFVGMGRESHGYETGVTWFLTVFWPLAVGLLVGGLVMRIWTDAVEWQGRLLVVIAITVAVGGPLRALTGRPMYSVFSLVALVVLSLLMFGWRLLRVAILQARGRSAASG